MAWRYASKPMNRRSGGTSILSPNCLESVWCDAFRRSSKRSAMANSLTGPPGADSALATAPLPRPPQPIKASLIVPSPAAWTRGTAMPASAEVAASLPARPRNSRRVSCAVEALRGDRLMDSSLLLGIPLQTELRERRQESLVSRHVNKAARNVPVGATTPQLGFVAEHLGPHQLDRGVPPRYHPESRAARKGRVKASKQSGRGKYRFNTP